MTTIGELKINDTYYFKTPLKRLIIFIFILIMPLFGARAQDYSQLVDPQIGTVGDGLGCGFNYIGASYPFGMVQFTPAFFSPHKGFVINQLSGAGCPNLGNFPVLPMSGSISHSPNDMNSFPPYANINVAHAGFLSVNMKDGTQVDLTVSKRSGIAKFVFDEKSEEGSVIIGSGISSSFVSNAMVKITSDKTCEGFSEGGEFCGSPTKYKVYFAAEFNRPAKETGTWIKRALLDSADYAFGENSGAYFTFDTEDEAELMYRIAISYVSIENAWENLKSADRNWDFEEHQTVVENVWNEALGKIAIKTENKDREIQFYTHLYHSFIHPNIVSDINGEYMGSDFRVHKVKKGDYYSSFSVWDTYRTQAQLIAMIFPKESSEMMQSAVDFADQSGGYGRWILANIETGIMQGDPTSILISNSYVFGATDFDTERAYHHMKRGATIPLLRSQEQEIRPHLTEYMKNGYTYASMMLEYTSADFAIGQFADQALGNKEDAAFFINRSQHWKNIYNTELKWLCSRHDNGRWKDIEHDWREASYKNYFWMIPYNLKSLIDTLGGKKPAEERLDELFIRLDASYEDDWFAAGNEPDFHCPWIYNWTNAPYKTSEVTHRIFDELYTSKPSGIPGNDDLGAMGAWYVFASIGLYPMIPGVAGFTISTPQFEEIKITLPRGILNITGGSKEKIFTKSLKINGEDYKSTWINWEDIKNGGEINYNTSKKADKNWGRSIESPSYNNY